MKTFLSETFTSLRATVVFAVLLCGIFPLIILGAGQLLFPHQANGSLIEETGSGLEWLAKTTAGIFPPRPRRRRHGYDAASSGGSNSTNFPEVDGQKQRVDTYRAKMAGR